MTKIGLCMIVKNESAVIERCLTSVRPLIDYALIVDTGSTDGTQDLIRNILARMGVPGQVIDEPWRDFAYNRSFALSELRKIADIGYAFIIDADDTMVQEAGFDAAKLKSGLTADLYNVWIESHGARYFRPQLCSNHGHFTYKSVLHEFLAGPDDGYSQARLEGIRIKSGRDGARSANPHKYADDAETLERALKTETDPMLISRYTFYLAQSYRDSGQAGPALSAYLKRTTLGHWREEIFESLFEAGKLMESLGHRDSEVIGTYLGAYEHSTHRIESIHAAVRYCRKNDKPALGYMLGKQAIGTPRPTSGLFIQDWIYDYGMLDEFSIVAYWSGHYQDCLDVCRRLLLDNKIPLSQRTRIEENASFASEKLANARQSKRHSTKLGVHQNASAI